MTSEDFDFICKLVRERSAIVLERGKEYLVEARLTPVVREMKLGSIADLVVQLRNQPANGLHQKIVQAMVTTETLFFRDHAPFEALKGCCAVMAISSWEGPRPPWASTSAIAGSSFTRQASISLSAEKGSGRARHRDRAGREV